MWLENWTELMVSTWGQSYDYTATHIHICSDTPHLEAEQLEGEGGGLVAHVARHHVRLHRQHSRGEVRHVCNVQHYQLSRVTLVTGVTVTSLHPQSICHHMMLLLLL